MILICKNLLPSVLSIDCRCMLSIFCSLNPLFIASQATIIINFLTKDLIMYLHLERIYNFPHSMHID